MNNDIYWYWREVWKRKAMTPVNDPKEIDGYEKTNIDPKIVAKKITEIMNIGENDKVLEVGCGAGMIAQYLKCNYIGIDYEPLMVKRHIELFQNSVLICEANDLIFKDNSFDKVFCYGVVQYMPNKEYFKQAVEEMIRVARKSIFVGHIKRSSHTDKHLLFAESEFKNWQIFGSFYNVDTFNAYLELKK